MLTEIPPPSEALAAKEPPYLLWWTICIILLVLTYIGGSFIFAINIFFWFGIPELVDFLVRFSLYAPAALVVLYLVFMVKGWGFHRKNLVKMITLSILIVPAFLVLTYSVLTLDSPGDVVSPCGNNLEDCRYP